MTSSIPSPITLLAGADFHVHLRAPPLSPLVVPTIRQGGVNQVYVMPNLVPPLTTVAAALSYREHLISLGSPGGPVDYLMTLYLHKDITPETIRDAASTGVILGVKSYPAGVTTNSAAGVHSYDEFFDVFAEMEKLGLVLNLHGEAPPEKGGDTTVLNAEERFLPTLKMLHERFPKLKIVLEHCTTKQAVEAVRACGENVVGTITAHHLFLTVDDWASDVHCFCKPVAKTPADRLALLRALVTSNSKFLLGTDSAPHPLSSKKGPGKTAAGVFTQPHALGYVMTALDEAVGRGDVDAAEITQEVLDGFFGGYGRRFYGLERGPWADEKIKLTRDGTVVAESIVREAGGGGERLEVVPFKRGERTWSVEWLGEEDEADEMEQ